MAAIVQRTTPTSILANANEKLAGVACERRPRPSPHLPGDVALCLRLLRILEDLRGRALLDQLTEQEKRGGVRDTSRLLHVVGEGSGPSGIHR